MKESAGVLVRILCSGILFAVLISPTISSSYSGIVAIPAGAVSSQQVRTSLSMEQRSTARSARCATTSLWSGRRLDLRLRAGHLRRSLRR